MSTMTGEVLLERLDHLWFSSRSSVAKGSSFEQLIAGYLRTAPEFADRFDEVYLWQEWPERQGQHDHGIDIVARDIHTGGWCAVQCKFYDPAHHVSKGDIDSFLAASGKKGFTSRIIVSTAKEWGPTVEKQLDGLQVPVVRIGLSDLLESKVDWTQVPWGGQLPDVLPTSGKKALLPHQREARKAVRDGLAKHDRGQLVMACGTGKTLTSLKIAEELATSRKGQPTTVVVLVPSLQLLNQTLREWKQEAEIPFRAFAVCSDIQVGRSSATEDLSVHDLIYPATTAPASLAREARKRSEDDRFTVIFGTYHSIDVLSQAQALGLATVDLVICDEAHRTTGVTLAGQDESAFVRVHDDRFLRATKRLYMTATPRLFRPEVKDRAKEADAVLASMDDEAVFGPVLHRLGFGEAVERDLLADYKVLVLKVDEGFVSENFQQEMAVSGEIKLGDAAKLVGCWNGLAKRFGQPGQVPPGFEGLARTPMRRAVAFAKDIRSSKAATQVFPGIVDRLRADVAATADPADPADATDTLDPTEPVDATEAAARQDSNSLGVAVRHVDGTMNALERNDLLRWLREGPAEGENTCRILTNARCLSEGVDVPALDAVMFLTPRGSQVDVVQSVGRVMRKAPGKDVGYIILPIVVPSGIAPEEALRDNERFRVVWEVLQALRAHDDRFNAMINKIDLTKQAPAIAVVDTGRGGDPASSRETATQLSLPFGIDDWRDSIYARIVAKVGERRYWETWAADVAKIAEQHIIRIKGLLADRDSTAAQEFDAFLTGLRGNLNDGISAEDAIEMLAQHLITRPVFDALFGGYDFAASNPVAQTMERMLAVLDEHSLDAENSDLQRFYDSVRMRVKGIDSAEGRQKIIVELYDKFFATAFKKTVDKLGIVYTPVEIVDFILRSADEVLREHFGQGLTDEGVHILDGFTGTGTFLVRLLQSGLITPHDLARKYAHELHANEILLLAYYIAAVNIETTYHDLTQGSLQEPSEYAAFPGLVLTDTFQSYEDGDEDDLGVFPDNNERINRQRQLPITVIVGNPPYSSGQDSANDNNANESYPGLDAAIRDSYAARSTATNKNSLYDSYIRAIMWASLRIKDRGVIAFVTNGGWLDSNTADGMRLTLAKQFSDIHVYNLRGNQRTAGEQSRKEGGKVFDAGSRATVAITILVKDPAHAGPARIHYSDIGDYLTRDEKLAAIAAAATVSGLEPQTITPNPAGDWLNQRSTDFGTFLAIANKDGGPVAFDVFSGGLKSNRDAWVYNSSANAVRDTMSSTITFCNDLVSRYARRPGADFFDRADHSDPTKISWDAKKRIDVERGRRTEFKPKAIQVSAYRPLVRQHVYFDRDWNDRTYRLNDLFPTARHANVGFYLTGLGAIKPFCTLLVDQIPDLNFWGSEGGQFFARWRYETVTTDEGMLALDTSGHDPDGEVVDGYRRIDNISDEALRRFRAAYGAAVSKDDIFHYIYGLLHSPDYRERYAADLKKMLPRIPLVADHTAYVTAGRRLAELHLGYEGATPYPLEGLDDPAPGGEAAYEHFRVEKMGFAKVRDPHSGKLVADRSTIVYNPRITLRGIPEAAYRYQLGSRSAIEWIIDRYQVKTDKPSRIVNDPNDWSREVSDPRYIIDLVARIVTVSLETMAVVDALPALVIRENQEDGTA